MAALRPAHQPKPGPAVRTLMLVAVTLCPAPAVAQEDLGHYTNGPIYAIARDNGRIYLGGQFSRATSTTGCFVHLTTASGLAVQPFPQVVGEAVHAAVSDGSGGWFIGGEFTEVGGQPRSSLAHILANGSIAAQLPTPNGTVFALARNGNTLYIGGAFTSVDISARNRLAAIDVSTASLTSWDPDVDNPQNFPPAEVRCLALGASGSLYVGGFFLYIHGLDRRTIAELDLVSGAPTAWNPPIMGYSIRAIVVDPNGVDIYIGGDFVMPPPFLSRAPSLMRLDSSSPETFTLPNYYPDGTVHSLALVGNTIYAGGAFTSLVEYYNEFEKYPRHHLAAFSAPTLTMRPWNPDADGNVNSLVGSGGIVYAGGDFARIGGHVRPHLAAIDATGIDATGEVTGWDPAPDGPVETMVLSGSSLQVGGRFHRAAAWERNNLAALDAGTGEVTSWDPGWDPTPDNVVLALATSGNTVYVGGGFTTTGPSSRNHLAAVDATTGQLNSWNPSPDRYIETLAVDGSLVYAGGKFTTIGGQARNRIAALNAATGNATGWNPDANDVVQALAPSGTIVYVGGDFTGIGGLTRNHIAALDAASGTATAWNPNADNAVQVLTVSGNTVYAGGLFVGIGGYYRDHIAQLDGATGLATPWAPQANGPVHALALTGNTLFAAGDFTYIAGVTRNRLAALNATNGAATSWDPDAGGSARALCIDGTTVFAGGDFLTIGGQTHPYLAAFSGAGPVGVPEVHENRSLEVTSITPLPARTRALIRYRLLSEALVTLSVYDLQGRRVSSLINHALEPAGMHEVQVMTENWPAGCYVCRLNAGGSAATSKLVVVH